MSTTSSIDFTIVNGSKVISPTTIIKILNKQGWGFDLDNHKEYLPVGDNDQYNWQIEALTDFALWELLKKKEEKGEAIGVVMTWLNSEIGGSFHFWSKNTFSIIININRKLTADGETDVNWYINKIVPPLKAHQIQIESIVFSEHI